MEGVAKMKELFNHRDSYPREKTIDPGEVVKGCESVFQPELLIPPYP